MISLLGHSVSAAAPWLLLGIPLGLAALVYIYRARGSSSETVVSTLLLLRQLPERLTARKRFSPPLQFWIDLAALSLLSLAAAGIFAVDAGKPVAIVVDSSLSMSARGPSGTTRFADAVRLATAGAASQLGTTRFTVYSAAASLARASEPNVSGAAAVATLSKLSPTLEPDRIDAALRTLLAEGSFDAVWAYTDKPLASPSTSGDLKVTTIPSDPRTAINVWISATRASADTITVEVRSVGESAATVSVSAECFGREGEPAGRIAPVAAKAAPAQLTTVRLSAPSASWQLCRIKAQSGGDSLPADNEAWVTRDSQGSAVQVISPLTLPELGLSRMSGYSFVRLSSADDPLFSRSTPTIVHRLPPPTFLAAPLLVVAPPQGNLPWGGSSATVEASSLVVTRWESAHPLLQYANLTLISIPRARPLSCAPGAQEILSSSAGALVCTGERSGNRYVVSALELFPFDGAASPTVSILTLNALKWLFGADAERSGAELSPGRVLLPAGSEGLRYVAPSLPQPTLSADGAATLPSPGVVAFTPPGARRAELRAVNIFSDNESDLSRLTPIEAPQAPPVAHLGARTPLSFAPWLAALALLVLLVDILRRIRSRSTWGAR